MGLVYVNNQVERMVYGENEEILFVTDPKEKNLPVLLKSASLVALNIPSFSSGIDAFSLASGIALKNVSEVSFTYLYSDLMMIYTITGTFI